jgi:hypothetical protein
MGQIPDEQGCKLYNWTLAHPKNRLERHTLLGPQQHRVVDLSGDCHLQISIPTKIFLCWLSFLQTSQTHTSPMRLLPACTI